MRGPLLLFLIFLSAGCQTHSWNCLIETERITLVTLESVTETKESQSRGYPVLAFPLPAFPLDMKHAGIAGEVVARLTVGPDGTVQQSTIVSSSMKNFEPNVLASTSRWIFRPLPDTSYASGQSLIVDCRIKFGFESN